MEENKQPISIWGKYWEPIRKWFYPSWLAYEVTVRFYDYSKAVYHFFTKQQDFIAVSIGKLGSQTLAIFSSLATFAICTAYLTIPACFALYQFFKKENLTGAAFETKLKTWF
ncbi:hypothetical protein PBT90_04115 [Algoriphagus halophytocola]|uniref:Uncharacterized protein n=1 Tax=Algoriphagus halophytocola TaxID=2991499 RepID=A0ABY6MHZ7_9BACT|nr:MULTISPECIES: hypothetical protein [unclassified Algoriphagus]UZD22604.1 hypothetical protein OM944_18375 [Algoriphagus sp. TR-M5]WBL43870.1 hypothetical protein PBT90_04115 [Algoriphagus sp. TR-M9]